MKNAWFESVDYYCERVSADFWAEPLNAISNIFFIFAALGALRLWRKSASRSWDMLVLAFLMLVVGVGSFTFHTVATKWAALADVIPIAFFIYFGMAVFLYRVANIGLLWTMLGTFVYAGCSVAAQKYLMQYTGSYSSQYIPALVLLFGMAIFTWFKKIPAAKYFVVALISFAISLSLRSIDMQICAQFPYGIHYMWHMLNSVVMYFVFKGIIAYSRVSVKV